MDEGCHGVRGKLAAPAASKDRTGAPNPALVGIVTALLVAAVGLRVGQSRRLSAVKVEKPLSPRSDSPALASPVAGPVSTSKPGSFPLIPAAPVKTKTPEPPLTGRRLHLRLHAKDAMAANHRFLHLLAEIPAQLVEPPVPIRYNLLLQPEVVEVFLRRLEEEVGPTEVQQDAAGDPKAPLRLTIEILPRD